MQEVRTKGHADPAQTIEESRPEQGSAEAGTLDEASTLLERREVGRGRFKVDQLGEDRLALEREEELAAERRQAPVDPRLAVDTDELRVRSRRDVEEWRLWLPECEQAGDLRLLAAHEIGELEFLAARANARNEVDGCGQRVAKAPLNQRRGKHHAVDGRFEVRHFLEAELRRDHAERNDCLDRFPG